MVEAAEKEKHLESIKLAAGILLPDSETTKIYLSNYKIQVAVFFCVKHRLTEYTRWLCIYHHKHVINI